MPHVGKPGSCSVVDIGLAPHDFRNHRQSANERGGQVADANGHRIAIHVGFAFPGIEHIDGFGTQDRLQRSNHEEHHDPDHRVAQVLRRVCRKVGKCQIIKHAKHAVGHLDQKGIADAVNIPIEFVAMLVQQIKIHSHRNRHDQDNQRRGNAP